MHNIKKRHFIFTQVNRLAIITFISSISMAAVGTIWAIYLESFFKNESYVGFLLTFFTIVAMVSSILIIPYVERTSKSKIYIISLLAYAVSYISFAILENIYVVVVMGTFLAFMSTLKLTSFGIILRDKSQDKNVSKNIGLIYTFLNLSWLLGPLLAGFISQEYGFSKVFLLGAGFQLLAFILFTSFRIKDNRVEKKIDKNPIKLPFKFFKDKNRMLVYILSAGVSFWWALIYIYIPMHIIDSGLESKMVGYFLFAIVVPLILFEYLSGKIAAKKGFRKMFFIGYLSLSILSLIAFFMTNVYYILLILVLASMAVAMIEPTTEAYFFDLITKSQRDKFYSQHNTALDVGNIIATFLSAIILLFLPFKFLFILFCVVTLLLAFVSLKIKNIVEARRE